LSENTLSKILHPRFTSAAMPSSAHRGRRSTRIAYEAVLSLCASLALFAFYQFHGVSEHDRYYVAEQVAAVVVCALSIWGAIRGFQRHGAWNRRLGLITLAVLLTTIMLATLLSSTAEPPKPPQIEYGEH